MGGQIIAGPWRRRFQTRVRLGAPEVAAALVEIGVGVIAVVGDDPDGARIMLESGLSVRCAEDGMFPVLWYHGPDPITRSPWTELCVAVDRDALCARIGEVGERFEAVRSALSGENRSLALESARALAAVGHDLRVVASEGHVQGAVAVSMRGMEFAARHGGARFGSLAQLDATLRDLAGIRGLPTEAVFDLDFGGHALTARPLGVGMAEVVGTLAGAHWFSAVYVQGADGWAVADEAVDDACPALAAEARAELPRRLARAQAERQPMFVAAEVRRAEAIEALRRSRTQGRAAGLRLVGSRPRPRKTPDPRLPLPGFGPSPP